MQNIQIARPALSYIVKERCLCVVPNWATLVWYDVIGGGVIVGIPSSKTQTAVLIQLPDGMQTFMPVELAPAGYQVLGFTPDRIPEMSEKIFRDYAPAFGGAA